LSIFYADYYGATSIYQGARAANGGEYEILAREPPAAHIFSDKFFRLYDPQLRYGLTDARSTNFATPATSAGNALRLTRQQPRRLAVLAEPAVRMMGAK